MKLGAEEFGANTRRYQLIGPSDRGELEDLLDDKDDREARQRLQALISEWLRMENLVVLTGAGCSFSSGGKLVNQLEQGVSTALESLNSLPQSTRDLLKERRVSTEPWAKTGFEQWLSYIANAAHLASAEHSPFSGLSWRATTKPSASDLAQLVKLMGRAINAECSLTLPSPDRKGAAAVPPHFAFLSKLVVRDSNLGRTHLFTLNYDTLFEQTMELLGIQYFDGFTGRAEARFDPSVYGLDIYYPGEVSEGRVRRFDKFIHFYKLHGSIHWFVENGELRARHPDLGQVKGYGALSAEERAAKLMANPLIGDGTGILPTANKFVQTLGMPFAQLFRSFQIRL
ncbi:MAG: SIR2 family protein, partial [Proteobacteria bacterium]|nr:SIR2 family protein [Pseudomonadota bacterium]